MPVLPRLTRFIVRQAQGPITSRLGSAPAVNRVPVEVQANVGALTRRVGNTTIRVFCVGLDTVDDPTAEVS